MYIFVCFIRNSLRVILQGFVDPRMQHGVRIEAVFASLQQGEHMVESTSSFLHTIQSSRQAQYFCEQNYFQRRGERRYPRRDSSIYLQVQNTVVFPQIIHSYKSYSVSTRNPATPSNSTYRINSSTRNTTTTRLIPCRSVQGIFQ